jgi:hypothetical protein
MNGNLPFNKRPAHVDHKAFLARLAEASSVLPLAPSAGGSFRPPRVRISDGLTIRAFSATNAFSGPEAYRADCEIGEGDDVSRLFGMHHFLGSAGRGHRREGAFFGAMRHRELRAMPQCQRRAGLGRRVRRMTSISFNGSAELRECRRGT